MAWRTMEVADQRVRFVVKASEPGANVRALCSEFGIAPATAYVWLGRYKQGGVAALVEQSRRPLSSPRRTAEPIEQRIVQLRTKYPDWGARKLAVLLRQEGMSLPSATVHRILSRKGLVRADDRHRPATRRFEREQPNQLWQMDFKSPKGWDQHVGPLSVVDDASRYVIVLDGTGGARGEAVQERLQAAFIACGLPDAMLMDHGNPWWNQQASGGWTRLAVWLMKQNIQLHFSGVRHPQTQGKVERFHGALEMARRRRGLPEQPLHQAWLDDFRYEYNHVRPHEALQMNTPANRWKKSQRLFVPDPPPWPYPEGAEVVRLEASGQLKLDGRRWQLAGPLAGEPVQLIRLDQRVMVFYRNTLIRELDLAGRTSTRVEPRPARSNVYGMSGDNV